jgi:glyoxalase family protein
MTIVGLHHITLVCANAQRTVDFYTGVLGLRLVKKTVNFDDPGSYHLYFGDAVGSPGSAITFFEWPAAPQGNPGIGGTHHLALHVASEDGLLKWKRRLTDMGFPVEGPFDHHYYKSLFLRDPDGVHIAIATHTPGWLVDEAVEHLGTQHQELPPQIIARNSDMARIAAETWDTPVPDITPDMALMQGLHHITLITSDLEQSHAFYGEFLGMQRVKQTCNFDDTSAHWYWGVEHGKPGTLITCFERNPWNTPPVRMGIGQTHHFALAVADEAVQLEWRERLRTARSPVSPVMERVYFKSIYTRDPEGHIVELATLGPGFTVDEPVDELGQHLKLPPWLEQRRPMIESRLRPVTVTPWEEKGPPHA